MFFNQFENIDPEIHGIRLPKFKLNEEDYSHLDIKKDLSNRDVFKILVEKGFQKRIENKEIDTGSL